MARRAVLDFASFPPFEGFGNETMVFLRDLEANNNREWFAAHKPDYESYIKFPMQCLIASLGEQLQTDFPEVLFDPVKSLYRIYRDTRFSNDKTPYKTHISAAFGYKGESKDEFPGMYIQIARNEIWLGGGLYIPSSEQLRAIRGSITRNPEEYLAAVNDADFVAHYGGVQGESLKKAPQGTDPSHPMIEHLRRKQFFAIATLKPESAATAEFVQTAVTHFLAIRPLTEWLQTSLRG
jgi:uncharacterized protein (TIGR02453 family)